MKFGYFQLTNASHSEMQQLQSWFHSAEQQQSWGGDNFEYPCNPQRFMQQLCRPSTQSFSLTRQADNALLGFGQICDRFNCHHLARLVIHADYRGQGLAKKLISALIVTAQTQQNRPMSLYVHRHNRHAVLCYQSFGFKISAPPEQPNDRLYFMTLAGETALQQAKAHLKT